MIENTTNRDSLVSVLTGACVDEQLLLMLGPQLAYGSRGNKAGTVPPNASLVVEVGNET